MKDLLKLLNLELLQDEPTEEEGATEATEATESTDEDDTEEVAAPAEEGTEAA